MSTAAAHASWMITGEAACEWPIHHRVTVFMGHPPGTR
jgi:hypothetical protein